MITNASPDIITKKPIRIPNLSEWGHLLQGCGIGIIIGHTFDIVQLSIPTCSVIFFCLVVIGGYMISSSKR